MGYLVCHKHRKFGNCFGPFCCRHVQDAVYGKAENTPHSEFRWTSDWAECGDDQLSVVFLFCLACVQQYDLIPGLPLTDLQVEEKTAFPANFPVCYKCLAEYEAKNS